MIGNTVYGQVIYQTGYSSRDFTEIILFRYDLMKEEIDTLYIQAPKELPELGLHFFNNVPQGLGFHPNGKLLLAASFNIIEIDLKTSKSRWLTHNPFNPSAIIRVFENVFSNEDGNITSVGFEGLLDFDFFTMKRRQLSQNLIRRMFSYYIGNTILQVGSTYRTIQIHNPMTNTVSDFYHYSNEDIVQLLDIARYYDNNYNLHLLSMAVPRDYLYMQESIFLLDLNTHDMTQSRIGTNLTFKTKPPIATYKGFRHNGYVLDLDADNSSGHYTGGFYDTLRICDSAAELVDEDIEFDLDDQRIDSITFQILGPRPETIYAESLEYKNSKVRRINEKRWKWMNEDSHQNYNDVETILRDMRYTASWDEENSTQRVIGINTYMNGDSTVSWSIVHLKGRDKLAGNDLDTIICDVGSLVDLTSFLDENASAQGKLVPEMSSKGLIFDPEKDHQGEYLYIVEEDGCADTAFWNLALEVIKPIDISDTSICRDEVLKFQIESRLYDSIQWNNSISGPLLETRDTGMHWVEVWKGNCTSKDTFNISANTMDNVVYDLIPDSLFFCAGSPVEWDLTSYELSGMVFDGENIDTYELNDFITEDTYPVILEKGKCADSGWVNVSRINPPSLFSIPTDTTICPREEFMVDLTDLGDQASWLDGFPHPLRLFRRSGIYPYQITYENCFLVDTLHITVLDQCTECIVDIPNAVTPNNDGINDSFKVFGNGCRTVESIQLYDRWGNLLINQTGDEIPASRLSDLQPGIYSVRVFATDLYGLDLVNYSTLHILH